MNFELSPLLPTTSPIATLAAPAGALSSDGFAALLDRSTTPPLAAEPKLLTDDAEVALLETGSNGAVAIASPNAGRSTKSETAIATADALVASLSSAPTAPEDSSATNTEAEPTPPTVAEAVRSRVQTEFVRSERKGTDREGHIGSNDEAEDGDTASTGETQAGISGGKRITIEPVPLPMIADIPVGTQPVSSHGIDRAIKLETAPPKAALANSVPAEKPVDSNAPMSLLRDGNAASETEAVAAVAMPKHALSREPQTSASGAAPVRAEKIAEIALGLADAQSAPSASQAGAADLSVAARADIEIAPAEAPARANVVERQLDLIRNEQWLGELAHDIASTAGNAERLSFRLMPQQLGRLDVDVSRSHNGLSLSIKTESEGAAAILSASQARLADEIRAQGVKLADTQMFSGDSRQSSGQDGYSRAAPLIETFLSSNETVDAPEPEERDGRYA